MKKILSEIREEIIVMNELLAAENSFPKEVEDARPCILDLKSKLTDIYLNLEDGEQILKKYLAWKDDVFEQFSKSPNIQRLVDVRNKQITTEIMHSVLDSKKAEKH